MLLDKNLRFSFNKETPTNECFYCFGRHNHLTGGQSHRKSDCVTRRNDMSKKRFRSNIDQDFAEQAELRAKRKQKIMRADTVEFDRDAGYQIPDEDLPDMNSVLSDMDKDYIDLGDIPMDVPVNNITSETKLKELSQNLLDVNMDVDSEVQNMHKNMLTKFILTSNDWVLQVASK